MYWGLPPATEYVLGAVAGRGKKTENQAGEISHSFPFQKQPIGNIFWPSRVGPLPELLPLHISSSGAPPLTYFLFGGSSPYIFPLRGLLPLHISSSGAPPLAYFLLGGHSLLEKRKKFKLQFMNGRLRGKSLGKGVASQGRILQGGALRIH